MKKVILLSVVSIMFSGVALADSYSFEPVEISKSKANQNIVNVQAQDAQSIKSVTELDAVNNERFQNALLELDSVQVDMRDKLLEYKSQYAEIDAQYNKYKTERKNMKKMIKQSEKRINDIDKYKKNIRNAMTTL